MSWIVPMRAPPFGIDDFCVIARQLGAQSALWAHDEHLSHRRSSHPLGSRVVCDNC
jgi:hypothetical protein